MIVQDIPIVLSRGMHEAMLKHADYTTTWLHDVETASNAERERFKETMQTSLAEEMERQRDLHREDATALKQNLWDPLQVRGWCIDRMMLMHALRESSITSVGHPTVLPRLATK